MDLHASVAPPAPFNIGYTNTAGRVVIGNGPSGLTDDANLFWDVSNHRLGVGIGSGLQHTLDVSGEAAFFGPGITYTNANWYDSGVEERNSSTVKIGINANGQGLLIKPGSGSGTPDRYINIVDAFGGLIWAISRTEGMLLGSLPKAGFGNGLWAGPEMNLSGVSDTIIGASNNTSIPSLCAVDYRADISTERTTPLVRFTRVDGGNIPAVAQSSGGVNAINDGTRRGLAFYSYDGANFKENFRVLDDQTLRLPSGAVIWNNGVQVLGPRNTGWTAMTGTTDKATSYDTSTITLAQLAGRVMALQAALTTHGGIGA